MSAAELIAAESARLAETIRGDLDLVVPSCPAWTRRDLVDHIGKVQRFWAHAVTNPSAEPSEPPIPPMPADAAGARRWYEECAAELVDAVNATPADTPCWTWWPSPKTAGAVARHQVQEVVVHRWDAELADPDTVPQPIPDAIALDGVDEFLNVALVAELEYSGATAPAVALEEPGGARWTTGSGTPVATVRASASELVLLLYRRLALDSVEVDGSRAAVAALLAITSNE